MNYSKQKETRILSNWKTIANKNGDYNFTYDGLMLRGEAFQKDNNWIYKSGDEEKMWQQNPGLLFITKDVNGEKGDDIRTWTGRQNGITDIKIGNEGTNKTFFSNLMRWCYGLNEILNKHHPLSFAKVSSEMAINAYDHLPIARINCKKECGKYSCSRKLLRDYFSKSEYKDLLKDEIILFSDAKIIYCGGNDVFDILRELFPVTKIETGCNKYGDVIYNARINDMLKIVVKGYHPAYPGRNKTVVSQSDAYDCIMSSVSKALHIIDNHT